MSTPTWQPGTLYAPGALVVPRTKPATTIVQPANASFESGDLTGWSTSDPARWAVQSGGSFSGTHFVQATGSGLTSLASDTYAPIKPGQRATVKAMGKITNHGTDDAGFQAVLEWWNDSAILANPVKGSQVNGKGGYWVASSASGVAPAGATRFRISLSVSNGTHGSTVEWDSVSYDYAIQTVPDGLVYEATQAKAGRSASHEPAWPGDTTTAVTDNEVTWQGKLASRVAWTASPICQSGGTEPTWPTDVDGQVSDGNMAWKAISRRVTDAKCPNSKVVAIMASKVFAADGDIVRFSATINPLDWSSPGDAGYLGTGLQQANANAMAVLAPYRSNLTAFNASSFQNWQVDPDPAAMALLDQMEGIGSTAQYAAQPVGNDLFYLSALGVRTVSMAAGTDSLEAGDVGMPIDPLVQAAMKVALLNGTRVLSTYIPGAGQYWLAFKDADPLAVAGALPDSLQGNPVNYQYTLSGGVGSLSASLSAGALPTGLSMDGTGRITGTASTAGTFAWTVRVTDSQGSISDHADGATITSTQIVNFSTASSLGSSQTPWQAAVAGGVMAIGYNNGLLSHSADKGLTWPSVSGLVGGFGVYSVANVGGRWYIANSSTFQSAGSDFVFSALANTPDIQPGSLCVANGVLFAGNRLGTTTTIYQMVTPGSAWTAHSLGGAYGNAQWVHWTGSAYLVGTSTGAILRSTDLTTWTSVGAAPSAVRQLAQVGSAIVVVTSNGSWSRSVNDGVSWAAYSTTPMLSYVAATPSMFVAARGLSFFTSLDGLAWTLAYTATAGAQVAGPVATDGTLFCAPVQYSTAVIGTTA